MNDLDEAKRNQFTDALTKGGIDARNLRIEVIDGVLQLDGTVADESQWKKIEDIVRAGRFGPVGPSSVEVAKVKPIDSADGRGRSPVAGVSADSRHESEHQLDK
jgi:hypothetical protein